MARKSTLLAAVVVVAVFALMAGAVALRPGVDFQKMSDAELSVIRGGNFKCCVRNAGEKCDWTFDKDISCPSGGGDCGDYEGEQICQDVTITGDKHDVCNSGGYPDSCTLTTVDCALSGIPKCQTVPPASCECNLLNPSWWGTRAVCTGSSCD